MSATVRKGLLVFAAVVSLAYAAYTSQQGPDAKALKERAKEREQAKKALMERTRAKVLSDRKTAFRFHTQSRTLFIEFSNGVFLRMGVASSIDLPKAQILAEHIHKSCLVSDLLLPSTDDCQILLQIEDRYRKEWSVCPDPLEAVEQPWGALALMAESGEQQPVLVKVPGTSKHSYQLVSKQKFDKEVLATVHEILWPKDVCRTPALPQLKGIAKTYLTGASK